MIEREVIESIVKTYDLPIKKRNKIINIAIQKMESFEKFSDAYGYINFLVERFHQTPYAERFFTRLDNPKYHDSETQVHELIYMPVFLEDNQKDLKAKLKKGQSILGRPIIQIEPCIKFGRRTYNKNPLALFRKHDFYKNKLRTEIYNIDAGMYEALRRWNQLHIAIPEVVAPGSTTKISKETENEIIKASKTLTSPTAIARKLNITRATVDYYTLKKHKLREVGKKGAIRYPIQMIKDIVDCLRECKIASKVAEYYGVSRFMVVRHGREAGVPILSRGGQIENILKNKKTHSKNLLTSSSLKFP